MLRETFIQLLTPYNAGNEQKLVLWNEIEANYTHKKRHYHTLTHLENLLLQLTDVRNAIKDWNAILFTLYYHDVIYNALRTDNEEKSAVFAAHRMALIDIPGVTIEKVVEQIKATKKHAAADSDTNYFTDADLSI